MDLWDAIKTENFIFSFRNNAAVETYTKMQIEYDRLIRDIRPKFNQAAVSVKTSIFDDFQ